MKSRKARPLSFNMDEMVISGQSARASWRHEPVLQPPSIPPTKCRLLSSPPKCNQAVMKCSLSSRSSHDLATTFWDEHTLATRSRVCSESAADSQLPFLYTWLIIG